MDEQLELRTRARLVDQIAPITGSYPRWQSSPAAQRVGARAGVVAGRSGQPDAPVASWTRGRVLWAVVVVGLIATALALVGIAGSRQLERQVPAPSPVATEASATLAPVNVRQQALVPSGLEVLSPASGEYLQAVLDADRETIWLQADGRLTRYSPATGEGRTWTIADDLGFAAKSMAAARGGGVWLVGSALVDDRTLRWFDGQSFRTTVQAPMSVAMVAEGPDGGLWAASGETDGLVARWDGQQWTDQSDWIDRGGRTTLGEIRAIAVDPAGSLWIGATSEVQRFDGFAWDSFDRDDALPLADLDTSITPLADGTVLVATMTGLARFDGTTWSALGPDTRPSHLATSSGVGPDGALWIAWDDGPPAIARLDGSGWTTFGVADGLPDADAASVVPTGDAVFAATAAGLYRLEGSTWGRAWPASADAERPVWIETMLPVSRNEGWAVDEAGLWHFLNGTWSLDRAIPDGTVGDYFNWWVQLARGPDGTVWAAGAEGLLRHDGDRWTVVDSQPARGLAVGPSGPVYISDTDSGDAIIRQARFVDGHWTWDELPSPGFAPRTMAVTADGTLWAGAFDWWGASGGLARLDGETWQSISIAGNPSPLIWDLVAAGRDEVYAYVSSEGALGHFDGSTWTLDALPAGIGDGFTRDLAVGPDGAVWMTGDSGLHRFDGQRWASYFPGLPFDNLAIADDGTGWAVGPSGLVRFDTH